MSPGDIDIRDGVGLICVYRLVLLMNGVSSAIRFDGTT